MLSRLRRTADTVTEVDRAVTRRIAATPVPPLDVAMTALTAAADHSRLWLAIAAVLATRRGATRTSAARGVLSVAAASSIVNALLKPALRRRRPVAAELPAYQGLARPPVTSSFPSGHAASAAAFATALAIESPRVGRAVAPVAVAVGYSRVHVGVHWPSDVLAGAALGAGVALATRRWWPVRGTDEASAVTVHDAPALSGGAGLLLLSNQRSGDPGHDQADGIQEALPRATVLRADHQLDLAEQLEAAIAEHDGAVRAIGVAGGDGTVAAAAAVALGRGLPLAVVPTGTLNHFARDLGVYDLQEVLDATGQGEAVAVDIGMVQVHPPGGAGPAPEEVTRVRWFLNTASIGSYPELVRLRERWQPRWGKWPAFAAALAVVLHRAEPVRVRVDGRWHSVWFLFVGNGPYHPGGMVPAWRPGLSTGLLDVRWLRADLRFSRTRAVLALATGALGHSRVYARREVPAFDVELAVPGLLATDGEVVEHAGRFTFRVAPRRIAVYRRHEENWTDRARPFLG